MSLFDVFNVSGSAMNAETIRLNTTASNLANAESVNGDATKVYRARHPVFQAVMNSEMGLDDAADASSGVRVMGGGEEMTFARPVLAGTRVSRVTVLDDIGERSSNSGPMLVLRYRDRYRDGDGDLLLESVRTVLLR